MKLTLPLHTFVLSPSVGTSQDFAELLYKAQDDVLTSLIDVQDCLYQAAEVLNLTRQHASHFRTFLCDLKGTAEAVGDLFLHELDSVLGGPDAPFIAYNCESFADIRPFAKRHGTKDLFVIQLGMLRADQDAVRSIWLPMPNNTQRLEVLEQALIKHEQPTTETPPVYENL